MRLVSFFILLSFFSCNNSNNQEVNDTAINQIELVSKADVAQIDYIEFLPDSKVKREIGSWEKYQEIDRIVQDVKNANVSFFRSNSEMINTLIEELKTSIPNAVDSPQVQSRMIALETKMFKLESVVNLSNVEKNTLIEAISEFLMAFSNLNLQMNKKIEKESQNIVKPS